MGACGSNLTPEERSAIDASRKIDQHNKDEYKKAADAIKLLLLGAGESGKSTIFKQMKILYGQGFTDEEKAAFKRYIWGNIIEAIKAICEAAIAFGLSEDVQVKDAFQQVIQSQVNEELTAELGAAFSAVWNDPAIQQAWDRRSEYQVIDTTKTYFDKIADIAKPDYMPTEEDILHSRVRTTGIVEERYVIEKNTFVMYDVGGQRNERKKWIHCFDGVNAVIFVAALSEFDQMLFEDENTHRMVEALNLFDEICNSRWFARTSVMLFLNKSDLFREKIARKNISDVPEFQDYTARPNDFDDGVQYFLDKFTARAMNRTKDRDMFSHVTCATNTENIHFVFNACKEIILKQNLEENGFIN